jgi:hypothetical protein
MELSTDIALFGRKKSDINELSYNPSLISLVLRQSEFVENPAYIIDAPLLRSMFPKLALLSLEILQYLDPKSLLKLKMVAKPFGSLQEPVEVGGASEVMQQNNGLEVKKAKKLLHYLEVLREQKGAKSTSEQIKETSDRSNDSTDDEHKLQAPAINCWFKFLEGEVQQLVGAEEAQVNCSGDC